MFGVIIVLIASALTIGNIAFNKNVKNSQIISKEKIFAVRLKQKGLIRIKEGQP